MDPLAPPTATISPASPLAIRSAEDFRRARPELLRAAEETRLSLLVGSMHLMAEFLAATPLICAAELAGGQTINSSEGRGKLRLIARAPDGFEHPAVSVARNLSPEGRGGVDFKGDKQSRLSFSFKHAPILKLAVAEANAIWEPALALLTPAELADALPGTMEREARGTNAADLARQWGFGWLAARIESMELSAEAQPGGRPSPKSSL